MDRVKPKRKPFQSLALEIRGKDGSHQLCASFRQKSGQWIDRFPRDFSSSSQLYSFLVENSIVDLQGEVMLAWASDFQNFQESLSLTS